MRNIDEITLCMSHPEVIRDTYINKGHPILEGKRNRPLFYSGGFAVAMPYIVNGEKWAFRCWHNDLGDIKNRIELVSKTLSQSTLPYFCDITYVDEGIVVGENLYPTTRMKWIEGQNLKQYICSHRDKTTLKALADAFLSLCKDMHECGFAHGDLQHDNIIVNDEGKLFLIDYDSMHVPQMKNMSDHITGKPDYQHPHRKNNKYSSEKLDYFSELIIYTSILAISEDLSLIDDYQVENTEALLFKKEDYENIQATSIYARLTTMGGTFTLLLKVLVGYLKEDDINNLLSFDCLLEKLNKEPIIEQFTEQNGGIVYKGEKAVLTWSVKDAEIIRINSKEQTILSGSYEMEVPPNLRFVCEAINGLKTTEQALSITLYDKPIIDFSVSEEKLRKDSEEKSILNWHVENASGVSLDLDGHFKKVKLDGHKEVSPKEDSVYRLKVTGLDGKRHEIRELKVFVREDCQISFSADKVFSLPGVPILLSWNVKNATSVRLDGFGNVEAIGSKLIEPSGPETYKLTAKGEFGETTKELKIQMLPLPIIKTLMIPTPNIERTIKLNVKTNSLYAHLNTEGIKSGISANINVFNTPIVIPKGNFVELSPPLYTRTWWRTLLGYYKRLYKKIRIAMLKLASRFINLIMQIKNEYKKRNREIKTRRTNS